MPSKMNVITLSLLACLIYLCESATINQKNDTLEVYKKDISKVGNAVATFTFDVIRGILQDTVIEDDETTTFTSSRKVRSASDNSLELCQQRCNEIFSRDQLLETQEIKDLKLEVSKLQEIVKLLREQQKLINILDERNATKINKQTRQEMDDDNLPNTEQLVMIKQDLKQVIASLNQTKEFMILQKKKDELIQDELEQQQFEIAKLKTIVDKIVDNSTDDGPKVGSRRTSARASELSDLKKLLKSLPSDDDDDEDDDSEIRSKIAQLLKQQRKKKKQSLSKEMKALEKSLGEEDSDSEFLKQLIKALRKPAPQSKTDDLSISNLDDLEDAINRLRPKEDTNTVQFQAMLNKLLNKPSVSFSQRPQPQLTVVPPQMVDLTKRLTQNNIQYICVPDDSSYRMAVPGTPRNVQYYQPTDYNNAQQFFPGSVAQPVYYPPPNANGVGQEKPLNYQTENANYNYQTDLKQQINGIQTAIDGLNRPEYVQTAEDKSTVEDLGRQIGDLRNIVDNLNYENSNVYRSSRPKRSPEDNKVEDGDELAKEASDIVGKLLQPQDKKEDFTAIQQKISALKNQFA